MSESCTSRHFSWLVRHCFPSPHDHSKSLTPTHRPLPTANPVDATATTTSIASLPDDLLLECLSRVPASCIASLATVCRRWSRLVFSSYFLHLRRSLRLLAPSILALSTSDSGLFAAVLAFDHKDAAVWKLSLTRSAAPLCYGAHALSNARAVAIGSRVYVLARSDVLRFDVWTGRVAARSPMSFPRKKFAAAMVSDRIYVAGGVGGSDSAVEEYDPDSNQWRVVAHAPRKRYGCIGAAVDGVFYVIGGLKIRSDALRATASGADVHVYACSMDLYDVGTRQWLRSTSVPGGGCVVAACAVAHEVYALASHAVELSFWRFDARSSAWSRLKSPPLPSQVRLDGTVRFSCVGVADKVALVQVVGCIDDLLRRSGRSERGLRGGLVLLYDAAQGDWSRGPDLPEVIQRAACVSTEC